MKGTDAMVSVLKRAAAGGGGTLPPAGQDGDPAPASKPADDEAKRAKREELKTAVMEFQNAKTPDEAVDAFVAAMELCKGYEAD